MGKSVGGRGGGGIGAAARRQGAGRGAQAAPIVVAAASHVGGHRERQPKGDGDKGGRRHRRVLVAVHRDGIGLEQEGLLQTKQLLPVVFFLLFGMAGMSNITFFVAYSD